VGFLLEYRIKLKPKLHQALTAPGMAIRTVTALVPFHDDGPDVEFPKPWIF
jgi:hypothetical protein